MQPFPEGIDPEAFDLEPDWKGVYLGHVQLFNLNSLVEWLPSKIDLEKWFIGRGGVTGKATAVFDLQPDMTSKNFAVRALRVAFRQNTLLEGLVQLAVKLVYYHDTIVYLDLAITNEPASTSPSRSASWAPSPVCSRRARSGAAAAGRNPGAAARSRCCGSG